MARIVHVLGEGRPGGGTTVVLGLSRMLAANGHDVAIITQSGSPLIEAASAEGFEVRGLDFSRRSAPILTARRIAYHLKQLAPAVIHAHGARAGLPSALVARHSKRKFIYTVQGFHFRAKPQPLRALACAAEALCMARADCTVFVSEGDYRIAERHGLLKFARAWQLINNAVAVDSALGQIPKAYDIGFLGRLHEQKNPLILADILEALRPSKPSLCVIGGGDLAEKLHSRLEAGQLLEQVTLQGERTPADALRLMASCRLLVFPSRWEGHPFVAMEAMHLGLPVVASDVPGTNEIIVDGKTGYLVPARDAAAYADRIRRLLQDPGLMKTMGQEGQQHAARECSFERMARAHIEIYFPSEQRSTLPRVKAAAE